MTGIRTNLFDPDVGCRCLGCHRAADIDELKQYGGKLARSLGDAHEIELPEDSDWSCPQCGGRRFVVRFSFG